MNRALASCYYCWIAWLLCGATVLRGAEGTLVSGDVVRGEVQALDASWNVSFTQAGEVPAEKLVYWGQLFDNQQDTLLLLSDGSVLAATVLEFSADSISIGSIPFSFRDSLWHRSKLPRASVLGLVLRTPADLRDRDRLLQSMLTYHGSKDVLWLTNGDRVEGLLLTSTSVEANTAWSMRTEAGDVSIDADHLRAISFRVFEATPAPQKQSSGVIGFRDGSQLTVARVVPSNSKYDFELASGGTLSLDARVLRDEVCYLRPPNAAITYLSDLDPIGYRHIPYLATDWWYYRDRSVLDTRLRLGAAIYEKGLGVHSTSRLAYDIPPAARRFQAELSLDATAGERGSVIYRVYLQPASGEWQMAYESATVRGGNPPRLVNIDLQDLPGARRIALIVDFADRGDELDRANWLLARFIGAAQ